jgi:hypothetical protein
MASRYTYVVDDTNAVLIWDAENPTGTTDPNIYQPGNPVSLDKPWSSKEEATAWAEETIASLINPPVVTEEVVVLENDPSVIDIQ